SSGAWCDESGIRTHASEETAALNQRLRRLGHLADETSDLSLQRAHSRKTLLPWEREILNPVALGLTRVLFEPTPPQSLLPKTSALDRSAISPRLCHSYRLNAPIKVREILNPVSLGLTRVGFDPTPPKRLVPKSSALDRSGISPRKPLSYRFNAPIQESHDCKNINW
ncbi:unnamed protein product, partial [Toxocara canis]|uniref:Uncharacterized protein n=1 Tax=Toxocara canis TaxID=6265 RepID=A0A183U9E8_TOXCA